MLKKRDAQGLPVNVIVIAVLALLVLVVLMIIFSEKTGESVEAFGSCIAKGGICKAKTDGCAGEVFDNVKCDELDREQCCVEIR